MKKIIPTNAVLIPDDATQVFQGEIFDVYQWPQEMFDGSTATFEMLKRPDTTDIICIVDGKILVLNEEQPNNLKRRNFPGGRVDPEDFDIVASAQREVLEEVGYEFQDWRIIRVSQNLAKIEWFNYVLVAWNVIAQQPTALDAGEKISVEHLNFSDVKAEALAGVNHLKYMRDIFEAVEDLDGLITRPEIEGLQVDR